MYEAVIGLEIHAQLLTDSKLFCACAIQAGAPPNSLTCPVCLGMPGTLPVPNSRAVDRAVQAALALACTIHPVSVFARKNYFYPDLPKGYQITQYDKPLATAGSLAWSRGGSSHRVGIIRVHLEEDAGKSLHEGFDDSDVAAYIDFNRSGIPLAEIVTAPDLRSPEDAAECFRQIRSLLVEAGVCEGNLELGQLRCDANVSIRIAGDTRLGERVEIKNLNSFRFLQRAIACEISRQSACLDRGVPIESGTRAWDDRRGETVPMRGKEDAREYRYFPEPDLPPLVLAPDRVHALARRLPELPEARVSRLRTTYGLNDDDAAALGGVGWLSRYFERVATTVRPAAAAQWIRGELARRLSEAGLPPGDVPVAPEQLSRLIALVDDGAVSATAAKQVLAVMFTSGRPADDVLAELGLALESDPVAIAGWVDAVLAERPEVAAQHQAGRRGAVGFLVGLVIKASGGRANPRLVDSAVRARLDGTEHA